MKNRALERRNTHRERPVVVPSWSYPYIESVLDGAEDLIREHLRIKDSLKTKPLPNDIVEWAEERFYLDIGETIKLAPHQKAILKLALTRDADGYFPYRTFIWSTIKKSGKSTIGGVILRWFAETQRRRQELFALGNDMDQAKLRAFREVRVSLEETPGYNAARDVLPGEWILQKTQMKCLLTGTEIRALAVDARGEAGGRPAVQVWTELWGFESEDALRFWDELTPIPTIPDSFRLIETYAGYEGESTLLWQQYELGMAGRQLTEGELRERTGIAGSFVEATNDDDLVPIWENESASLLMYWDTGLAARRMPWQQGPRGDAYYREQELSLTPNAYARLHLNEWTSSTTGFVPIESWDACEEKLPPLLPGDKTPLVIGVDAATTGDCFAIVAVSRHPTRHEEVAVRRVRVWDPKDSGGVVDYSEPEAFLRGLCKGWCNSPARHANTPQDRKPDECEACANGDFSNGFNVQQITYDPHQLVDMMQRLARDRIAWTSPFQQGSDRLEADKQLYDLIMGRRITHDGNERLRQHVQNSGAKVAKEDSTLRLVKKSELGKIDATVALSMAAKRALYLLLPKTQT